MKTRNRTNATKRISKTADLGRHTLAPEATLLEAMDVIEQGGIELAFVVDPKNRVIGTLSDGDVRRAILGGMPLGKKSSASQVMRRAFISVGPDVGRAEVLDTMRIRNISQIPVLDSRGIMVGLHLLHELIGAVPRPNRVVIMAGGQGVRLRPLTEHIPKPMLTVAGRPILERIVLHLVGYGIREISLSINYLGEVIERHFKDGSDFGCHISYIREKKPMGTGGSLSLLPPSDDAVLVMNGDLVTQADIGRILDFHAAGDYVATSCLRPYQVEVPFGVAEVRGDRLLAFREKPTEQMLINAGIYVLSPKALRMIPKDREYPITQLFETCLSKKLAVGAHVLEGDWMDVGRHEELRKARGF